MEASTRSRLREFLFRTGVVLKGIDALVETAGGVVLLLLRPHFIVCEVLHFANEDIAWDPLADLLEHAAHHLSLSSEHFLAAYLLIHGITKAFVVWALFKGRLWAYPVSLVVFAGFIAYQVFRYTQTGSIGLLLLTAFDVAVVWLIWLEYRAVRSGKAEGLVGKAQASPGD